MILFLLLNKLKKKNKNKKKRYSHHSKIVCTHPFSFYLTNNTGFTEMKVKLREESLSSRKKIRTTKDDNQFQGEINRDAISVSVILANIISHLDPKSICRLSTINKMNNRKIASWDWVNYKEYIIIKRNI